MNHIKNYIQLPLLCRISCYETPSIHIGYYFVHGRASRSDFCAFISSRWGFNSLFSQEDIIIWTVIYLFGVFFFIDMYLKLHVCFSNNDGVLVTYPTATSKHYLKTNFIIDFLALDLIILGTGNPVAYNYSK